LNAEQLEELLILHRPNRPGEDGSTAPFLPKGMKGNVLKMGLKIWALQQHLRTFVDENEAVNYMLQVVCRDKIPIGITYKQSKHLLIH